MFIILGADETSIFVFADLGISTNISGRAPRFTVWNREWLADFPMLLASTGSGRLEAYTECPRLVAPSDAKFTETT
jgi:hypothetical protein